MAKKSQKDRRNLQQKRGMWYVVISITANGKRQRVWHPAGPNVEDAKKLRNDLLHQKDIKTYAYSNTTYGDFLLNEWLPLSVGVYKKISTQEGYERIVRLHLIPALGSLKLGRIEPGHISRYIKQKKDAGDLSVRTIRQHYQVIRASLKFAVAQKKIATNPALNVDAPAFQELERDLPSEEELRTVFEAIRGTKYYLPAVVSAHSTMRRGEIFGLKWSEIDFQEEGAKILRTLYPSKKGLIWDTPKNKGSRRLVALPSSLMPLLAEHKLLQDIQKASVADFYEDNNLVFCREDGRPINPSTFSSGFCAFRKRHNLPYMRFHDFRHLSVDTLYETQVDQKTIMKQAGHSTVETSLRYNHPTFRRQKKAVEKADSKLRELRQHR